MLLSSKSIVSAALLTLTHSHEDVQESFLWYHLLQELHFLYIIRTKKIVLCHWPKQKLLLQMVGHVYSLLLFIHKCLLSWDARTVFPFPIQQPSSKQPHYIFMRFGHFRCLINTVDHVIVETQDWNQPAKCYPLLIHHLVIISLVQAVPILDCLERDAVSRFVGASSSVFQGESEAQTSSKYVNECHSRASVAEPGCRWHDCVCRVQICPHGLAAAAGSCRALPRSACLKRHVKSGNCVCICRRLDSFQKRLWFRPPIKCSAVVQPEQIKSLFGQHFDCPVLGVVGNELGFNQHWKLNIKSVTRVICHWTDLLQIKLWESLKVN